MKDNRKEELAEVRAAVLIQMYQEPESAWTAHDMAETFSVVEETSEADVARILRRLQREGLVRQHKVTPNGYVLTAKGVAAAEESY